MNNQYENTPSVDTLEQPTAYLANLAVANQQETTTEPIHITVEQPADEGQPVAVRHE